MLPDENGHKPERSNIGQQVKVHATYAITAGGQAVMQLTCGDQTLHMTLPMARQFALAMLADTFNAEADQVHAQVVLGDMRDHGVIPTGEHVREAVRRYQQVRADGRQPPAQAAGPRIVVPGQ